MVSGDRSTAPTQRSLKERQREERAALILQAAEAVLAEKGYHDTSMDEIASRVGIAKGTIYLHYPSKDDLVVDLFARELAAFRDTIARIAAEQTPARARLEAILRHVYAGLGSQRQQLFASLSATTNLPQSLFAKHAALREYQGEIATTIQSILVAGQAGGEFNSNIPTGVMLTAFLGLLSPRSYAPLLDKEHLAPDELARAVSQIFFQGITHKEGEGYLG
jgi:TetR/AcrR family transcriptional regulator, fatty acid metabolism regulator protein